MTIEFSERLKSIMLEMVVIFRGSRFHERFRVVFLRAGLCDYLNDMLHVSFKKKLYDIINRDGRGCIYYTIILQRDGLKNLRRSVCVRAAVYCTLPHKLI